LRFSIEVAERSMSHILGNFSKFIEELPKLVRVTAGATSTRSRRESQPFMKLSLRPVTTASASPYVEAIYRYYGIESVRPVGSNLNRVELVPKNWKTDRTIACEPEGNVPLQLAFDSYAKRMLCRKVGCDLSNQSRNQRLAIEGSRSGAYATIDLSMASDTVAYNAVQWLMPDGWREYVTDIRTPLGRMPDGSIVKYAKFSSMGNGSTFTIETLIFASLCEAAGAIRGDYVVYGDDIIVKTEVAPKLYQLLAFFGFRVNQEKTFTEGPFRESCGVDSYEGYDITPFYVRRWTASKADISHNVNGLLSISVPYGKLADYLMSVIQTFDLPLVPYTLDTLTGVHLDPGTAWKLKKLGRNRLRGNAHCPWTYVYKPMLAVNSDKRVYDSRGYYLWFIRSLAREGLGALTELATVTERSKAQALD
jgi:hypothetical protein